MRPSANEYYLNVAKEVASRSTCLRRRYGAIIVNNDQIVSTGYNGSPRKVKNCDDHGVCYRAEQEILPGQRYEMCLTGDTRILLDDGTSKSMEELYNERRWGIDCLSYDKVSDSVVVAKAEDIRITEFIIRLYEITLLTGDVIRCTEDNKFLLDNNTYVQADKLCVGISLKGGFYLGSVYFSNNIEIQSVELIVLDEEVPVYDITVPMYENFAISLAENNFIFSHNCHSVHAEANAILSAARKDMIGGTLYLVGIDAETNEICEYSEPCMMCRRYIINSGITKVISLGQKIDENGKHLYESHTMVDTLIEIENSTFKPKE